MLEYLRHLLGKRPVEAQFYEISTDIAADYDIDLMLVIVDVVRE